MNHRIVTAVVALIIAVFVASAFGFAWAVEVRAPEGARRARAAIVPHPLNETTRDCVGCHDAAAGRMPLTHRYFESRTCLSCHDWRPLGLVPHSVAMGDARCVLCHGDPTQDFGMPRDHLLHTEERCLFCHAPAPDKASLQPEPAGESASVRPEAGHPLSGAYENCLYCHRIGGTPSMPDSHAAFDQATCTWCHVASRQTREQSF